MKKWRTKISPAGIAVALVLWFLVISQFVDRGYLTLLLNSMTLCVGAAVFATYFKPALKGLVRKGRPDRVTQLIMGISLSFLCLFVNRTGMMFAEVYTHSLLFLFVSYLAFLAGILHITPQSETDGKTTPRSWLVVIVVMVAAVGLTAAILKFGGAVF